MLKVLYYLINYFIKLRSQAFKAVFYEKYGFLKHHLNHPDLDDRLNFGGGLIGNKLIHLIMYQLCNWRVNPAATRRYVCGNVLTNKLKLRRGGIRRG